MLSFGKMHAEFHKSKRNVRVKQGVMRLTLCFIEFVKLEEEAVYFVSNFVKKTKFSCLDFDGT